MPEKEFKPTEEVEAKEGYVRDYITNELVRTGVREHKEAVNVFAKKLVEDLGYSKNQIQTIPQFRVKTSPSGKEKYPVDITVFKDDKKTYDNVYMLIECKQPNRKDGLKQLNIYLNLVPSVELGVWFNGKEHLYLWKIRNPKTKRWEWKEIPELPKRGQRVEDIGLYKRKDLVKPKNLKMVFNDIRNHLAGNITGITRDEAIAQEIINLLFCKIYDEINTAPEDQVTFRVGINESKEEVKKRISKLFMEVLKEYDDVFDQGDRVKLDADSIVYVVGELQRFAITEAERDAIGDAFEVFIGPALRGGEGQFFTPRNVVKMTIEILNPKVGEYVIDPACGSGGFLIVALEYIWKQLEEEAKKKGWSKELLGSKRKEIASKFIAGIDKDSFLAKVTKAYMAIVGDGRGGIFCENSLLPPSEWNIKTKQKIELGKFDVLVTNPPFGAKIPIRGDRILEQYELGFKWKLNKKTNQWERTNKLQEKQPPQILFIERCLQLLKPGGRMGIVLPDGILAGDKVGYIASFIKDKAKVIALIDCPLETFSPSVTTKTHVVFLEKKQEDKDYSTYKIFMAVVRKIGHDRKGKEILKTNEHGKEIVDDDLPLIVEEYKKLILDNRKRKSYTYLGYLVESKWLENNLIARSYLPEFIDVLEEINRSKFTVKTLGEIKEKISTGANIGAKNYSDSKNGKPYILVKNITDEGINVADLKYIDNESYKTAKSAIVKKDDIVINRCGNAGIAAIVPEDLDGAVACGFVFKVTLKKEYDPYYVVAFLNSRIGRMQMNRVALGTVLDHITKSELEKIKIIFPPLETVKKISNIMRKSVESRVTSRVLLKNALEEVEKTNKII